MMRTTVADLLAVLADRRPLTSVELQTEFGISQPTVSRLLRKAGDRVVPIGAGPSTRYTTTVDVFGAQPEVHVFAVAETGVTEELCSLRQLATGGFVVGGDDLPFWLLGESGTGDFRSLPYFLADLRPSGFLGRLNARRLAATIGAPDDPRQWSVDQVGRYLLLAGVDLPGNLVLGARAAHAANRANFPPVRDRVRRYPDFVQRNLDEDPPGSSAAGEQPKFLAHVEGRGHVIVKYSEPVDTSEGRRWADLLAAEFHALRLLADQGLPAANAEIFRIGDRVYLESQRFDRAGSRGRRAAISLGMVDAEFSGEGSGWSQIAHGLRQAMVLEQTSHDQIVWLEAFGHWIGNSDLHPGNLSLYPGFESFALRPVYDMLPMRLARPGQPLESIELAPPLRTRRNEAIWERTGQVAGRYWQQLRDEDTLSDAFRAFADRHARRWSSILTT